MTARIKICWICTSVSGVWLLLSALVAWNIVPLPVLELPIGLLMGGSVVGIAYQLSSLRWKAAVIVVGMPTAFLLIAHLTPATIFIELIALLLIAYLLFAKKSADRPGRASALEDQMKHCC